MKNRIKEKMCQCLRHASFVGTMVVSLVCACNAYGEGIAPISPQYIQWQREHEVNTENSSSVMPKTRLRSASDDDVARYTFGQMPSMIDKSYLRVLNISAPYGSSISAGTIPESYDQRKLGNLTGVKNQGQYGTCWAHSTIGAIETLLKVKGKEDFDFSEKHMANTHGWSGALKNWTGVFGDGAWAETAMAYLVRWSGPIAESEDPYPSDYYKNNNLSVPESPKNPIVLGHVQNIIGILPMPEPASMKLSDTEDIKRAVMQYGSVRASYKHVWGAMTGDNKNHYWDGGSDSIDKRGSGGHSVLIVGWDDDYSKSNFKKTPPGNGAFIAKNSWGRSFGEDGYFYISYYDITFGRDELHAIPDLESIDNHGEIYEYDPLGWVNNFGGSSMTMWGANMFSARKDDVLDAVGFYVTAPNTEYKLYVFTGCSPAEPVSGDCAYSSSGTIPFFGYATVALSQDVKIRKGQMFSIVLELTTPGNKYPLPIEYATVRTIEATASSGQSFYSESGSYWRDFAKFDATCNFCCKAYTKSARPEKPTLASIAVMPEDEKTMSLKPGASVQLKCEATYSNNAKSNVTDMAQWSLASGQAYAAISAAGLLTAKDVIVPEPQTITVQAIYLESGVTATNRYGFSLATTAPSAPTDATASQGTETSCIRVRWSASAGATEYAVYRAPADNSKNAHYLDRVTVAKYNDTSAVPGVNYWYFIKARNSSGTSEFSTGAMGWRKLSPPDSVVASDNLTDKIDVKWGDAAGAKAYRVYRSDTIDGDKKSICGWLTATTYQDKGVAAGKVYYYYVVAAVDTNGTRPSDYSVFDDGKIAPPVTSSLFVSGPATIESGKNGEYTATVEYSDKSAPKDVTAKSTWVKLGDSATLSGTGGSKVKLTAKTISENQTVKLIANYMESGKSICCTNMVTVVAPKLSEPTGLKVTSQTANGVVLSWNGVSGASSYKIYRAASGTSAKGIGETSDGATSYLDDKATPGVTYAYSVAAVNSRGESTHKSTASATVPLSAPMNVNASNDRTDCVVISWRPVAGATHYRVARATSKSGAKADLGGWLTDTMYSDASAVAGTTYYYFVRAATSSSGANVSGYSDPAKQGARVQANSLSSVAVSGPDKVSSGQFVLYSCTATYTNGQSEQVKADWSVSSTAAATIDGDGRLTAKSVSKDTEVTVKASFTDGATKTASKKVIVLAATTSTTAQIIDVDATSRWPFASLLDIDYTLVVNPSDGKAVVSVFGRDEDHGVDVAAKTLSGDGSDGSPISAGKHRMTWDIGADYPDFHAKVFNLKLTATPSVSPAVDSYVVTYKPGSKGTGSQQTATKTKDAALTLKGETFTRTGYKQTGWAISDGGSKAYNLSGSYTANAATTLYPFWTANAYTIKFNANGGSGTMSNMSMTYDVAKNLTKNGFTKRGSNFAGWATSVSGNVVYADASSVKNLTATQGGAVTLYAKWTTIPTYTVTYLPGSNGAGAKQTATKTKDVALTLKGVIFSRTGYTQTGWAASDGGGKAYELSASYTANAAATLYPFWTANTYTIKFNANGGAGTMPNMSMTYDVAKNLANNAFTKSECNFAGWATSANGNVVYADAASVKNLTATQGGTVTLYAKWTEITTYTITYMPGANGTGSQRTATKTKDVALTLMGATFTRTGYTQAGWATSDGGDKVYELFALYTANATLTLYPFWKRVWNLTPLRNLVTGIEKISPDGVLSDYELNKAMTNPHYADLDGTPNVITAEEMSIFKRIQALNTDKTLITKMLEGDYSSFPDSVLEEMGSISEAVKTLTANR